MSGVVAERLFACVPPLMPERDKFDLAGKLWERYAPTSSLRLSVGPSAPLEAVLEAVSAHLDAIVQDHYIPPHLSENFLWLADNDVVAYERLLNFFVRQEKKLALQEVSRIVPLLQKQKREHPELIQDAKKTVRAGKHSVELLIEGPAGSTEVRRWSPPLSASPFRWPLLVAGLALLCFLLFR